MIHSRFLTLSSIALGLLISSETVNGQWSVSGQGTGDNRNQPSERILNAANVANLTPKWVFTTGSDVSATPTVAGDAIYFPDWAGNLYAVNKNTGKQIWTTKVSSYTGVAGDIVRVSPAVVGDELIFGDNQQTIAHHNGANLIAVSRQTGALRWMTQIESHPAAIITGPAAVFDEVVYQGVSSIEEGLATNPAYVCCTFRGSISAVNARTGRVLWKTYSVPDNQGAANQYSGGAIWQQPVIDPQRGVLYVGTGNNYSVPASVEACEEANSGSSTCADPTDYFDTALALSLRTGAVKWSKRLWDYDAWTVACIVNTAPANCPSPDGEDYDLGGSGGNLLPNMVGFGQKSGVYWALNPANGNLLWGTVVGGGGSQGGIQWGTATDGKRIYVAIADANETNYTLPSGQTINWGSWSALDPATGKILWQTADPTQGARDLGSVSVANGVVYAGSMSGNMYALNAATGQILWSFNAGGSVIDGPSIVDGVLYWGSGYSHIGGTGNNKVYAFSLPEESRGNL